MRGRPRSRRRFGCWRSRGSAGARRRPDDRQRDEGARRLAGRPRRPEPLDELRAISVSGETLQLGAMATYTRSWPPPRSTSRGRSWPRWCADRRRPGAQPRHDRRQRLLERPHEPPAAAARRARRLDDDPRCERRAHGLGGGVLPRRLHDRGRRGRAAPLDLGPRRGERRRRLRLDHDRPRRNLHRNAAAASPTSRCGSRSAASTLFVLLTPPAATRTASGRPSRRRARAAVRRPRLRRVPPPPRGRVRRARRPPGAGAGR